MISMKDSIQTADYMVNQKQTAEWNVISQGTISIHFDNDDRLETLSPSKEVYRKSFFGGSFIKIILCKFRVAIWPEIESASLII